MIIKCQYTGIEFEARSKRSKNHPLVSEFLNEAAKENGHYRGASHMAKEFIKDAVVAAGPDASIEEIMEIAQAEYEAWKEDPNSRKHFITHKQRVARFEEQERRWRQSADDRENGNNTLTENAPRMPEPPADW